LENHFDPFINNRKTRDRKVNMETVSIGYYREDGDFVILATLNNNYGKMANSSFHELVKGLRESITARVCNPSIEIQILERQDTPDFVDVSNQPEGAVKPREASQGEATRSEREIVEQTEKLASMLFCFAFNSGLAGSYRNSENPRAQSCWRMACEIQAMLTDTDAENAAQEIESEPDKGGRQSPEGFVGEPDSELATVGDEDSAGETVRMRLTFDVTYSLNGENATEVANNLRKMCERAVGEGMLTGEMDAEVEEHSIEVVIEPERSMEKVDAEFKNFHRQLCTQFGYTHDEKDWKRDQVSLIEWIRRLVEAKSESAEDMSQLLADIEEVNAEHDKQSKPEPAAGQDGQQNTLRNFVVLYRDDSIMSDEDDPFGFQCYAESSDHATEQCLDAYDGCNVVWVWQGPAGVGLKPALNEYWASKQVSDDEVICPHCGEKSHIGGLIGPLANQCPKCGKQCDGQKPNPITSFNLVMPTLDEMAQYDAVEVHPVESTIGKDGKVICEVIEEEQIDSNPLASYSWSVYLHLKEGGTDLAGDFPTRELADAFAAFADLALVHAAQVAENPK